MENPGFDIFGWHITWYGVIMASAMIIGIVIAYFICKLKKYDTDIPINIAIIVLPLSVIGARLYYVAFNGVSSFWEVFAIWNGGLAIYGGVIGGFFGILIYSLIKKEKILKICDIAAPALILGQAIGRWGNFINQEAYGGVVTNPKLQWFPFSVLIDRGDGLWHYATFFYESMWNIIGFVILMLLIKYVKPKGIVTAVYFVFYGIGRMLIEGLRTDSLYLWNTNIRVSQALSGLLVVLGIIMIVVILVKENKKGKEKQKV